VAVYYGTTPDTQAGGLIDLCENQNVDIVILSFVYDFFTQGGYPSINFGPACSPPNEVQSAQAPGLMDCTPLAPEVAGCQQIGRKVLISLGGYIANSSFFSDDQAEQFAQTLWNLFGAGTGDDPDLRPFGSGVVVDGFDIDNENHVTSYYETFASALRQEFASDPTRTYYLSAAPQCPMPDESIPVGAMTQADFVWVQFYNNPSCNLDSDGFQASFAAWSANLSASSTTPGKPRVYIGAGAFEGAGSGYVEGAGLSVPISMARELYVDNLGGIMLWDGSEALANVDGYGVDYLEYAKAVLQG
jgi:chitinase